MKHPRRTPDCHPTMEQNQNMEDCISKGRAAFQRGTLNTPCGQDSPNSKLSNQQVSALLADLSDGMGPNEAAKKYGTAVSNVVRIKSGKAWKHVPRPPMPRLPPNRKTGTRPDTVAKKAQYADYVRTTGASRFDAARHFGVNHVTIWRALRDTPVPKPSEEAA